MYKVTNLTNAAQDLQTKTGRVILPAFGYVVVDIDLSLVEILKHTNMLKLEQAPKSKKGSKQ